MCAKCTVKVSFKNYYAKKVQEKNETKIKNIKQVLIERCVRVLFLRQPTNDKKGLKLIRK